MKKTRNTAFAVELLALFALMLFLAVTVTRTMMKARSMSISAEQLTRAVTLAEEAAEAAMAADDAAEAKALLSKLANVQTMRETGEGCELWMEAQSSEGKTEIYRVTLDFSEEKQAEGLFLAEEIRVYNEQESEPLYTLNAGAYKGVRAQ